MISFRIGPFSKGRKAVVEEFPESVPILVTLLLPNFRRHLSSAFFFNFNKLSFGKFICEVERLNVKQRRSR